MSLEESFKKKTTITMSSNFSQPESNEGSASSLPPVSSNGALHFGMPSPSTRQPEASTASGSSSFPPAPFPPVSPTAPMAFLSISSSSPEWSERLMKSGLVSSFPPAAAAAPPISVLRAPGIAQGENSAADNIKKWVTSQHNQKRASAAQASTVTTPFGAQDGNAARSANVLLSRLRRAVESWSISEPQASKRRLTPTKSVDDENQPAPPLVASGDIALPSLQSQPCSAKGPFSLCIPTDFGSPSSSTPALETPTSGGSRAVPFQVTTCQDGTSTMNLESISVMPQHENKSPEQIRVEDYSQRTRETPSSSAVHSQPSLKTEDTTSFPLISFTAPKPFGSPSVSSREATSGSTLSEEVSGGFSMGSHPVLSRRRARRRARPKANDRRKPGRPLLALSKTMRSVSSELITSAPSSSATSTPYDNRVNSEKVFEIKIALVGFVSVGKTTILNALLRDKYGEVSMKRTTAGVNYFRIANTRTAVGVRDPLSSPHSTPDNPARNETFLSAKSILTEITRDNARFRERHEINEKYFEVALNEPLCDMRQDTQLVLVDIPGVNEAGGREKYRGFVREKWNTFDCVIVVVDGRQGVNTQEQVNFLEFIKENLNQKKNIPVIILANKVDTSDDQELNAVVSETRREVERLFGVRDRQNALNEVLDASTRSTAGAANITGMYPIFIPVSAIHAYTYRTAALMTLDQFKEVDQELLDKIGCEELGRFIWKKMPQEERVLELYKVISDPDRYKERLEATNFDKFLAALSFSVGGDDQQRSLIFRQLEVALQSVSIGQIPLAEQIRSINDICHQVGIKSLEAEIKFWNVYNSHECQLFQDYSGPGHIGRLAEAMNELVAFHGLCVASGWDDSLPMTVSRMKSLVRRQFVPVFKAKACDQIPRYCRGPGVPLKWASLTIEDWKTICRSVLMASHEKHFIRSFCQEKVWLERTVDMLCKFDLSLRVSNGRLGGRVSHAFPHHVDTRALEWGPDEKFTPMHPSIHNSLLQVQVPETIEDPAHWGHLAWRYCEFMASLETQVPAG